MSVESIWANFKDTDSFLQGIREASAHLEPGDVEIISTSWIDSPVEVDVHRPEEAPDTLEIRPMFFGETLDLSPVVTHYISQVNNSTPKP